MGKKELSNYIEKHLGKGYSLTTLTKHLTKWGYTQKEIEAAKPHPKITERLSLEFFDGLTANNLSAALKHTYFLLLVIAAAHIIVALVTKEATINMAEAALTGLLSAVLFAAHYVLFVALLIYILHLTSKHIFKNPQSNKKRTATLLYAATPYLVLGAIEPTQAYTFINLLGISLGLLHFNLSMILSLTLFCRALTQQEGLTPKESITQLILPTILTILLLVAIFLGTAEYSLLNLSFQPF